MAFVTPKYKDCNHAWNEETGICSKCGGSYSDFDESMSGFERNGVFTKINQKTPSESRIYWLTKDNTSIRVYPSGKAKELRKCGKQKCVKVLGRRNGWYKIQYTNSSSKIGYVPSANIGRYYPTESGSKLVVGTDKNPVRVKGGKLYGCISSNYALWMMRVFINNDSKANRVYSSGNLLNSTQSSQCLEDIADLREAFKAKTKNLKSYKVIVRGWDYSGKIVTATIDVKGGDSKPTDTLSKPTMPAKPKEIANGYEVTLQQSKGATLHYELEKDGKKISSGTKTGECVVLPAITTEGKTKITAWSSQSGYKDSGEASWTIEVSKASEPAVNDRQIGDRIELTLQAEYGAKIKFRKGGDKAFSDYKSEVITLKDGETISYYAIQNGHTDSPAGTYTAEVTTPEAPEIKLTSPDKDIASGRSITVSWAEDKRATEYTATLYDAQDKAVQEIKTEKNTATFTLKDAGEYHVQAVASNELGDSEASDSIAVTAHDPLRVVFKDGAEGEVLCSLTVEYGGSAGTVPSPSRKGYIFNGWENEATGKVSTNEYQTAVVKEDTTYIASYTGRDYMVKLRNPDGKVIDTQKVRYGEAVDTESVKGSIPTDTGYVLSGWQVLSTGDDDSAADINAVDSNMDIQAVVSWANPDLKVIAEITKAELSRDGKSVTVGIKLSTEKEQDLKFYVIAALKAADSGKSGLEKTIYTDRKIVYLNAGSRNEKLTNIEMQLLPNATNELSKVEVTAVQCNEDMSTGGAWSEAVSRSIEIPTTVTKWGDWSDWSTAKIEKTDSNEVEVVKEYRSRNKEYAYSGYETLSGYTKMGEETISSAKGKWLDYNPGTATDRYNDYKEIRTVSSTDAKKYITCFCNCYKVANRNKGGICKYCGGKTGNGYEIFVTPAMSKTIQKGAYDSGDGSYEYGATTLKDRSQDSSSGVYMMLLNGKRATSVTTKAKTSRFYLYPAVKGFDSKVWQATYTKYRNKFWRWGTWSEWSTNETAATADKEVETREVYRSREQITETGSESASAAVDLDPDNTLAKTVHGTLNELGITQDLSGRNATVMVYQTKNDDPNKYQLRHLGHTVIQSGNVYDFSFVPDKKPDADTGDYIISLAIEGFSGLIRVDSIKAPEKTYAVTVEYAGEDGSTVTATQEVPEHGNIDLSRISVPVRKGYIFTGWSAPTTNITETSSKKISAVYAAEKNAVVFVDWVKQTVDVQKAETGEKIAAPAVSGEPEGYIFKGWKLEDGTIVDPEGTGDTNLIDVTGDMVVTAEYEVATHTVTFLDAAGDVLETQEVEHGRAAKLPAYTEAPAGAEFISWGTDEAWWSVEDDITVRPVFRYTETAATPTSYTDVDDETGTVSLILETEDEGTDIYYTVDGTLPTEDRIQEYLQTPAAAYLGSIRKYSEPIELTEDAASEDPEEEDDVMSMDVFAVGYADGRNVSEVHSAILTTGENDDPLSGDAESAEWNRIGEYKIKVAPGKDVHVLVDITENPGITGYDVLIENPDGIFNADRDEYGDPVVTDGIAVSDGSVTTSDEDNGWRVKWNGLGLYEKNGNLFEMVLHTDETAAEGIYPVTVSYAPEGTLDYEYDPMELSGLKASVNSDASIDIASKTVVLPRDSYVYEGEAIEPAVKIEGLKEGTDYTVEYADNIDVGTARVVVTGMGDYAGTARKEFAITQANIANAEIAEIPDEEKTGAAIEPELKVTFNGKVLEKGKDYEVTYANNTEVGTATVTVSGIGNFKGTAEAQFSIVETPEAKLAEAEKKLAESEQARAEAEARAAELQKAKEAAEKAQAEAAEAQKQAEAEAAAAREAADKARSDADKEALAREAAEAEVAAARAAQKTAEASADTAKAAQAEAEARAEAAEAAQAKAEADLATARTEQEKAGKQAEADKAAREAAEAQVTAAKAAQAAAEANEQAAIKAKEASELQAANAQNKLTQAETALAAANAAREAAEADAASDEQARAEAEQKLAEAEEAKANAEAELREAQEAKEAAEAKLAQAEQEKAAAEQKLTEANQAKAEAEKRAAEAEKALEEAKQGGSKEPEKPDTPVVTEPAEIVDLPAVKIAKPKTAKKSATVRWKKLSKKNRKKVARIQIQYSRDKSFVTGAKTTTARKTAASKKIRKLASKKTYYVRVRSYRKVGSEIHVSKWSKVRTIKIK